MMRSSAPWRRSTAAITVPIAVIAPAAILAGAQDDATDGCRHPGGGSAGDGLAGSSDPGDSAGVGVAVSCGRLTSSIRPAATSPAGIAEVGGAEGPGPSPTRLAGAPLL